MTGHQQPCLLNLHYSDGRVNKDGNRQMAIPKPQALSRQTHRTHGYYFVVGWKLLRGYAAKASLSLKLTNKSPADFHTIYDMVYGWLLKLWSLVRHPKYEVPYYIKEPKRDHDYDNHPYINANSDSKRVLHYTGTLRGCH